MKLVYPGAMKARAGDWALRRLAVAREEAGSGLIEMALVLPVFFLMVFGFINFAMVMSGICNATFATRSALRYATLHSSASYVPATALDVTNVVKPFLPVYPQNTAQTSLAYSSGNTVGSTATVSIDLTYRIVLPGFTMNAFTVHAKASGVIVQ